MAADFLIDEERKREDERERRDRKFWKEMFGASATEPEDTITVSPITREPDGVYR